MRGALYAFLLKHMAPDAEVWPEERATQIWPITRLNVTRHGHVEERGSRSVHALNLALATRQARRGRGTPPKSTAALRETLLSVYLPDPRLRLHGQLDPASAPITAIVEPPGAKLRPLR